LLLCHTDRPCHASHVYLLFINSYEHCASGNLHVHVNLCTFDYIYNTNQANPSCMIALLYTEWFPALSGDVFTLEICILKRDMYPLDTYLHAQQGCLTIRVLTIFNARSLRQTAPSFGEPAEEEWGYPQQEVRECRVSSRYYCCGLWWVYRAYLQTARLGCACSR